MKKSLKSIFLCSILLTASQIFAQVIDGINYNPNLTVDTTKKSIKARAVGVINGDTIQISYHSPGVRGRTIWGGLVPYNEVWVTGAHYATSIEIPVSFSIAGTDIPAGKYAFFTIPGKDAWTLIINRNWDQHLADDYDAKEDIVRLQVKPKKVKHTERLQYYFEPGKGSAFVIAMAWETLRVELPVVLKK